MKVVLLFLFSFACYLSFVNCSSNNSTGWVVGAFYKDKACFNIDFYYLNQIGVCEKEGASFSTVFNLNTDGSVSESSCTNSSDCSSGCFSYPLVQGECNLLTVDNTSVIYNYYESFPTKLFDEKHNHLLVQFKGNNNCKPEDGFSAVMIQADRCIFGSCDKKDSLGKFCKIPDFLLNA